ncbi:MAG: Fic family protein [Pseudohongiellaceae bacterium]
MSTPYHYDKFPPNDLDWPELIPLIGPANAAIARYEGVLQGVPNSDVLLSPLTTQEAVLSSRIEGTQATLGEVLEFEAEGDLSDESTPKKADIYEIQNYREALRKGTRLLDKLSISQMLVRILHKTLMRGVRGKDKTPGEYRTVQNWIGPLGCSIDDAYFVPCRTEHLLDAMNDWEAYLGAETPDRLIQLAIMHAEFEAIHPFLDGNGRVGRLIIPLFLKEKGLLGRPNFYLSGYLEQHRDEYYARLLAVSRDGDWTGWCAFFLEAVIAQAEENGQKAEAILNLYAQRKNWIVEAVRSQYAVRALDWFFGRPIFRTSDFVASAGIPAPTAIRILRVVRNKGLLRVHRPGGGRQPAVLLFPELLNIAEGGSVF